MSISHLAISGTIMKVTLFLSFLLSCLVSISDLAIRGTIMKVYHVFKLITFLFSEYISLGYQWYNNESLPCLLSFLHSCLVSISDLAISGTIMKVYFVFKVFTFLFSENI